jgi:hypothetical protein
VVRSIKEGFGGARERQGTSRFGAGGKGRVTDAQEDEREDHINKGDGDMVVSAQSRV